MFTFVCRNVRDGSEDISAVSGGTLYAIAVIYTAFTGLVVDVKVLEVVVKVDGSSAEISAEKGGMGREYGSDVEMTLSAKRDGDAGLPFMEMGNDSRRDLARNVLGE